MVSTLAVNIRAVLLGAHVDENVVERIADVLNICRTVESKTDGRRVNRSTVI